MSGHCTVQIEDQAWRVLCTTDQGVESLAFACADDAGVSEKAQAVAACITQAGASDRVVVTVPSQWCLSATIDLSELGRSNRRQAMRYLLEEHLPLSAEDSVVDFVQRHSRALGVAAELDRVRPVVEALRAAGLRVSHLCPSAMLVAQRLCEQHPDASAVCIQTDNGLDLIELDHAKPTQWWWLREEASLVEQAAALQADRAAPTNPLITLGVDVELPGIELFRAEEAQDPPVSMDGLAASASARVLAGEVSPWFDLCQDTLAEADRFTVMRSSVGVLAVGVVLLLICTSVATFWRGQQYAEQAETMRAKQAEVYKQLMPGQRVPASISSRLRSEQRRLTGIGGDAGEGEGVHPISALTHLERVLSVWPTSTRCRLSDLTIEPGLVRVNGESADNITPERFAAELRETGDYEVDSANLRSLPEFGYSFTFRARPIEQGEPGSTATEARR